MLSHIRILFSFTCLGDRVSAGGGCKAAVTARIRCGGLSLGRAVSWCLADYLLAEMGHL